MSEQGSSMMFNPAGHEEVFEGYKAHSTGLRVSTELVVLDLLQRSHPDFHITCASLAGCDFQGFARAGHATIAKDADDETFDSTRIYSSGGPRLEKDPGSVSEHVRFGRWIYTVSKFLEYYISLFTNSASFNTSSKYLRSYGSCHPERALKLAKCIYFLVSSNADCENL
jgi:hypothetical protein